MPFIAVIITEAAVTRTRTISSFKPPGMPVRLVFPPPGLQRYELMKSPERDVADEGASPYGDGFILDGVAAAVRENGLVGNPSNPLSAGVKHGGYVGS